MDAARAVFSDACARRRRSFSSDARRSRRRRRRRRRQHRREQQQQGGTSVNLCRTEAEEVSCTQARCSSDPVGCAFRGC